jgi:hypothetical protein
MIQAILRDWLVENSYLPVNMLVEDTKTDGSA